MFIGCYEISIDVIVKHVQHVGIVWNFCQPWGNFYVFQCLGTQKKLLGLGLRGGISIQADIMNKHQSSRFVILYTAVYFPFH